MVGHVDEDNEWDQLNKTTWKGLKLSDPIKTVEVHTSYQPVSSPSI